MTHRDNENQAAHWYAAYTRSRHEKAVAAKLEFLQAEHFLPLYYHVSRWSDRKVKLHLPLFPGYVFVRTEPKQRVRILQVPGVIAFVSSNGNPVPLPDDDIERLQASITQGGEIEPHDYLQVGRRVRLIRGPFEGYEGILQQKKNKTQIVISIHQIMRSFAVTVAVQDLDTIDNRHPFVFAAASTQSG
jgi:transcription antitermination factor NusG